MFFIYYESNMFLVVYRKDILNSTMLATDWTINSIDFHVSWDFIFIFYSLWIV